MGTIKSEVAFQTTSASRVKFVRIFVFVVAGMAGLLFGLDQGVISGALLSSSNNFLDFSLRNLSYHCFLVAVKLISPST